MCRVRFSGKDGLESAHPLDAGGHSARSGMQDVASRTRTDTQTSLARVAREKLDPESGMESCEHTIE